MKQEQVGRTTLETLSGENNKNLARAYLLRIQIHNTEYSHIILAAGKAAILIANSIIRIKFWDISGELKSVWIITKLNL